MPPPQLREQALQLQKVEIIIFHAGTDVMIFKIFSPKKLAFFTLKQS
jgi:hypothetical protein